MLVLAGLVLAIGIIVDDAIADVDTIARRFGELRRENGDQPAARTIVEASLEVRRPVVYATLIVVLAVVPVLFMESLSAAFFRPLAVSYLVAVLASMLVALTVTPVLALTLLSRKSPGRRESPLVARIQRGYGGALSRLGRRPALSFVAAGVILVLGLAAWPLIGQSLFPSFKERNLLINWDGPPGTSLPEQRRITTQAIGELRSLPGVSDASAHIGRAVMSDQLVNVNSGEIWVDVDPAADYDSTVASVQRVVAGYPGLSHDVETYESERVNEVLTKTRAPLVVRIYGDDLGVLNRQANRMRNVLAGIDGVVDPRVENMPEEPTLAIKLSLPAAQRYGLTPGDVRRETATLLSGITVGSLFEQQKVFDVQVWGTSPTRHSVTSVRRLRIETPDGGRVALGKVAQVRLRPQPTVIRREAVSRYIDVTAGVSGQQDPASVAAAVDRRLHGMSLPLEYRAELLGRFSGRESVPNRLLPTAAAAAVGIFLLLQAAFASWRLALLLFATLVVAAAGGMVAAWMAGGTLSLGSLFGFLAVLGITARASLLLIGRYRYLEEHGSQRAGPNVVLQGAGERLGPVVAASLATVLAFVPFLVLGDVAGLEIVQPMAVVVMGGLLTALLLNLFILPIAYLRFGSRPTAGTGGK
jgi:Cu/Ag efflux pump CusA